MTDDRIRLVLPADPAYGRIARIATSNLAQRLGFDRTQIEDLRIAVDELVILLLRHDEDDGTLTLELVVRPDELDIAATVQGTPAHRPADAEEVARFAEIVGPTVDQIDLDPDGTAVRLHKRLPGA